MTTFISYLLRKKAGSQKDSCEEGTGKKVVTTNIYTSPGTTVVVQDRKGNKRDMRDVDEYNRRYDAKDNEFAMEDDTLYVKEKLSPIRMVNG